MRRDDNAILLDIAHAAALVAKFQTGKDETAVLCEAAKRLSPVFRFRYPNVPWSDMAVMRDKLIHAYEAVDYDEVWKTATKDIPELLLWVTPLLPEEPA
jgi:uncharacterized protein with HEPN domain